MLTRLIFRNLKRFREATVDLGGAVVLIGPNNSGKTTALQALALWDIGIRRWFEKRRGKTTPEKRPGVTINRRDLSAIPIPDANLLWRNLHVRDVESAITNGKTATSTQNVRIDVVVSGVTDGVAWDCGLEFDYANAESFYCRPLRTGNGKDAPRMPVPDQASGVRVAYLPPMSGLADREFLRQPGEIGVLIGQGQTAQVLRNLCYQLVSGSDPTRWKALCEHIGRLFGVRLREPLYVAERGEITMEYEDRDGTPLDLSSSGRGLQQTLLLLAHLYANPGSVLLLDEPDAHLEILRQRQTYKLLTDVADEQNCQIVAASHSEVVLNEAAGRDVVVAFVGTPHRIDNRSAQVLKSLRDIGFDHYYQAEQVGWVLYLEGSTDIAILQAFAALLKHEARTYLERPFVHYVGNVASAVREHFWGLREAKPDLVGVALFDRPERELPTDLGVTLLTWRRREIENYVTSVTTLKALASSPLESDWFEGQPADRAARMEALLADLIPPIAMRDPNDRYWHETKISDDLLEPLFQRFAKIAADHGLRKSDYHRLARHVDPSTIDPEVREKLDAIVTVGRAARPRRDEPS